MYVQMNEVFKCIYFFGPYLLTDNSPVQYFL